MSAATVTPIDPTPDSLIASAYRPPDYHDAFHVLSNHGKRVEDFATNFFLAQPRWLAKVSMNLGDVESRHAAIGDGDFRQGASVGSWNVHGRSDGEVVFGEHMGFMEYRFSFRQHPDGSIEAATAVKYLKRFGYIYFAVVKPFHVRFVRLALRNAVAHADEVGAP